MNQILRKLSLISIACLLLMINIAPISAQETIAIGEERVLGLRKNDTYTFEVTHEGSVITLDRFEISNDEAQIINVDTEASVITITAMNHGTSVFIGYFTHPENEDQELMVRLEVNVLEGIAFETQSIQIDVEETTQVNVVTNPNAQIDNFTVTYVSQDPNIVTVNDQGQLTGLSEGTTTVEAHFLTFSTTLTVEVINKPDFVFHQNQLTMNLYSSVLAPFTLSIHGGRDDTILWESENEAVVTVDEQGWLTAIGTGETNIVATVLNRKYYLELRVQSGVVDFTVYPNQLNLEIGDTSQLQWNIEPQSHQDYGVTWTSSRPSVATVNNGLVKAIGPGVATISARVDDIVRVVEVHVLISVDNLSVMPKSLNIQEGNSSQLSVIYKPSNTTAPKNPKFTSADEQIASVNQEGVVRGESPGQTTIFIEDHGFSLTVSVTVNSRDIQGEGQYLEGRFISPDEVTFDLPSDIENLGEKMLRIGYEDSFDGLDEITLEVILSEGLLDHRILLAQGLYLSRGYENKQIHLNVRNHENEHLFSIEFQSFGDVFSNLYVTLYEQYEDVTKKQADDIIIHLPFTLSDDDRVELYAPLLTHDQPLYVYSIAQDNSTSQLDDVLLNMNEDNLEISDLSRGWYLISYQNNDMILNDLLIYVVSGLAFVAVLGFILYKVSEMRRQDKADKQDEYI